MKNVLITGAAGGVGKEVTKLLSQSGYFVYALDIKRIDDAPNVKSFLCDLTKENEILKVYEELKNDVKLDAIIHFSGIYFMDSLVEVEEERLKKIFDINFFSVYLVNKIFVDILKRDANIIITSSELAPLSPLPFNGIYSLTKCTIEHYALSLRQELNLLGIKVTLLRPGAIQTSLIDDSIRSVDEFLSKTKHYETNALKFREIVINNESKTVEAPKLAKLVLKILGKKKPKLLYKINLNKKLILLSMLPKRMQLAIIKKLLQAK